MELAVAVFGFGALLLLVGIVGGDLSFQGATVPRVGRLPRFTLTVLGAAFVAASGAMWLAGGGGTDTTAPQARGAGSATAPEQAAPSGPEGAVGFSVVRDLALVHRSEEVEVAVAGRRLGTLVVDEGASTATLAATVAEPGPHAYDIRILARTPTGDLSTFTGAGTVDVVSGARLRVVENRSSAGAELVPE